MSELARKTATDIVQYDPEKGLKSIAVAEAAETHFARAKDSSELFLAVKVKLENQRDYVLWRDERIREGRPRKNSRGNAAVLPESDPGQDVIDRWRKALKKPDAFKETLEKAQEKARRICEFEKADSTRGTTGTGENEWYTPEKYIELARTVLGAIDLDPASSDIAQETVQAERYFTAQDNGLIRDWEGRVWLNPPYAQPYIAQFVEKMVEERNVGHVSAGIMLTHNYTDTSWFHSACKIADAICFTRGRIKFLDADGNDCAPTQGQAFFYFGKDIMLFESTFFDVGFVVARL